MGNGRQAGVLGGPRQGERGRGAATFWRTQAAIADGLNDPEIAAEVRRADQAAFGDGPVNEAGMWRFAERLLAERDRAEAANAARDRVREDPRKMDRDQLKEEVKAAGAKFDGARKDLERMEREISRDERRLRTLRREAETTSREDMRANPAATLAKAREMMDLREKTHAMGRDYESKMRDVVRASRTEERREAVAKTRKLEAVIEKTGAYDRIGTRGGRVRFDPAKHQTPPGEAPPKPGTLVKVIRPGYEITGQNPSKSGGFVEKGRRVADRAVVTGRKG